MSYFSFRNTSEEKTVEALQVHLKTPPFICCTSILIQARRQIVRKYFKMENMTPNVTFFNMSLDGGKINTSLVTPYQDLRSSTEIGLEVFLAALLGVVAAVGNTFLIIALHIDPNLRRSNTNKIIESLAWTDVINAFLVIPIFCVSLAEGKWVFDTNFCNFEAFILALTTFATLDTLAVLALNRLLKIVFNKVYNKVLGTPKKTNIAIVCVWLLSAVTSGTPFIGWGAYAYIPVFYVCTLEWHPKHNAYLVFANIVSTYPATALVIICYIWIYLYQRVIARRVLSDAERRMSRNDRLLKVQHLRDVRVLKITTAVVSFYLICWFPIAVLLNLKQHDVAIPRRVALLPPFLKFVNSCGNPIFYIVLDRRIRNAFLRIIRCGYDAVQGSNEKRQNENRRVELQKVSRS